MQIGVIGLGKMGANITRRLLRHGHDVVVHDQNPDAMTALVGEGAHVCGSLDELVTQLSPPRAIWLMLPAGTPTSETITSLQALLSRGDILIDGGNTDYRDDIRRAKELAPSGIVYMDVGTSGGIWGLERGYCLMIGGPTDTVSSLAPIFASLAMADPGTDGPPAASEPRAGYIHAGPAGAGHYVKMVHNAIEYGMMQALAEGMHLLHAQKNADDPAEQYALDLAGVTETWRHGSVVSSWLLDLTAHALADDPDLDGYSAAVADSGEGRWALRSATDLAVPVPALAGALFARFRSRLDAPAAFGDRLLTAMRHGFGGHTRGKS